MKYLLSIFFLLSLTLAAQKNEIRFQAQKHSVDSVELSKLTKYTAPEIPKYDKNAPIPIYCGSMPTYRPDHETLNKFVIENLRYPNDDGRNIEGRVLVRFTVMETGDVDSVRILKSLDSIFDAECIRVVKLMPRWRPATCRGKATSRDITMPFVFRLKKDEPKNVCSDSIHTVVDKMPEFSGGTDALHKFITQNLRYPIEYCEASFQGKVYIRFVVTCTGEVKNAEVLRAIDPPADKEALRVVGLMPRWRPAVHKGVPVSCYYTIPVSFNMR